MIFGNRLGRKLIYIFAEISNKIIPFVALPFYARHLSTTEFGIVSNFTVLFMVFSIFIGLSSESLYAVNYYKHGTIEKKETLGNQIIVASLMLFVLIIIGTFFERHIFQYFGLSQSQVTACGMAAFFGFFTKLFLIDLRFNGQDLRFLLFQSLLIITNVVFSIVAILFLQDKVFARISALCLSYISLGLFALVRLLNEGIIRFNKPVIKEILRFGLPIIPYQFNKWFRNGFDKLLLTNMVGLTANGSYSYLFQIANIPSYLGNAFNLELTPRLYKILSGSFNIKDIFKYLFPYFLLLFFLSVCYGCAIFIAGDYLFVNNFSFNLVSFILILIGSVFHSMTIIIGNIFQYQRKNGLFSAITVIVSVLGQFLNFYLIGLYEIRGACLTFMFLETVIFAVALFYVRRLLSKN
jgi:O-antigen/teichoic acid export membrane protein